MNFESIKHVEDLIFFEMSLLWLGKYEEQLVLVVWHDTFGKSPHSFDVWWVVEIDALRLAEYVGHKCSLLEVLQKAPRVWKAKSNSIISTCEVFDITTVPEKDLPSPNSYYDAGFKPSK